MKNLIASLAITLCCLLGQASYAQNIEGQIIASQFGQFQVPGIATGSLAFEPSTCQVTGGGKNFAAFATGVPVKIVDANPNLIEVDTPSSVNITGCSISMATTYIHTVPFYVTSGTGGLQEALTNGPNKRGGPNTVILNADWYTQVAPSNPATVIASVKGSTSLGLVDVTTIPYTVYQWNGSAYVQASYGNGNLPGGTGMVKVTGGTGALATAGTDYALPNANTTGTAANLSGTPALPNGTTAVTGTVGENDNKLATNAQVFGGINGSIPSTTNMLKGNGTAGQAAAASPGNDYVSPNISNGMNPLGTAVTGTNQNSNQMTLQGSYCTGSPCAASGDFYGFQDIVSTGVNPSTILNVYHAGSSGPTLIDFNPPVNLSGGAVAPTKAIGDNSTNVATTAYVQSNAAPGITPAHFGAFGDAQFITNGCNTTASSTTVVCPSASFVSGDAGVGKEIWIGGAGVAGGALGSVIATVVNSTTITISPTGASATLSNAYAVYGHDDVNAIQACWNYSAANRVQCIMNSPTGYLEANGNAGNGLQIAVTPVTFNGAMNVQGVSQTKGTVIYSEINGDAVSLQAGPVQGAIMSNISFEIDQTQPNSRGIHLNATPAPGSSSNPGGLFNSTLFNVQIDNPAQECLWMDGGGGAGYAFNLPNQYINLWNFTCNGPNQMHTANLILMTGQDAQIEFIGGATNGQDPISNYPNYLISVKEKTGGLNDAPEVIKFLGHTAEVGSQGLNISQSTNIHFDDGYMERVGTGLNAINSSAFTFNGNHLGNVGFTTAIATFGQNVTGSFRDNLIFGNTPYVPLAMAVCSSNNGFVDFTANSGTTTSTTGCATIQQTPAATFNVVGTTAFVNASTTAIATINAPNVMPGKTLTLYAAGTFTLGTGGNINFGTIPSPLTVATGQSVTLTLFDVGPTWLVTSTTAAVGKNVKIINGIGYSTGYTGATLDVRVNACIADAMNLANGNYTGICDASGETGTQTTAATITVGNSSGTPVTLYLPAQGQWLGGMTGGTSPTINQYGNTSIMGKGAESGIGSQFVIGATATSSLSYVFLVTPLVSQLNYIHDSNFSIVNVNGGPYVGHVTANSIGAYFNGPMYDSTTLDHVVVFDALDANSAEFIGWCCGAVARNVSINGDYGSGVTPLLISNTSAFNLETLSVVHPGSGKPIIQFTDASAHTSNVGIHGLYMETSNSDTSTALLQNSGYGSINLSSVTAKAEVASDAATILTSTNTTNTGITIDGFNAVNGAGDFFYPVTVVNNSFTGEVIKTDSTSAKGNLGFYTSVAPFLYSAAGTALPSCSAAMKGKQLTVSDATTPTFLGTYTSGGAVQSPVTCNGTSWVTF